MNAFDYFFEKTSALEKPFLAGKEEISFRKLYDSSLSLASWLEHEVGRNKHIILISVNNLFCITSYLAIIKSGNICIPLDPGIEKENFNYISGLTKPALIFLTRDAEKRLDLQNDKCIFPDSLPVQKEKDKLLHEPDFEPGFQDAGRRLVPNRAVWGVSACRRGDRPGD